MQRGVNTNAACTPQAQAQVVAACTTQAQAQAQARVVALCA